MAPSTPTCCCCPAPRTGKSGGTSPPLHARRRRRPRGAGRAGGGRRRPLRGGAGSPGQPPPHPAGTAAEGAGRRRRRGTGRGRLGSTGQPWFYDAERYSRVAAARVAEQNSMLDYEFTSGCRMEFLARRWTTTPPSVRPVRQLRRPLVPRQIDAEARGRRPTLGRVGGELEPRLKWPGGMDRLGVPVKGKLKPGEGAAAAASGPPHRPGVGRTAAGTLRVRGRGPAHRGRHAAGLRAGARHGRPGMAATRAGAVRRPSPLSACPPGGIRHWWDPLPRGSPSRPDALPRRTVTGHGGPPGDPGGNSAFRLAAVWDRLVVGPARGSMASLRGPGVMLLDDLVDSRWTITVAGPRPARRRGGGVLAVRAGARRAEPIRARHCRRDADLRAGVPVQGQAVRRVGEHQDRHGQERATERAGRVRVEDRQAVERRISSAPTAIPSRRPAGPVLLKQCSPTSAGPDDVRVLHRGVRGEPDGAEGPAAHQQGKDDGLGVSGVSRAHKAKVAAEARDAKTSMA